MKPKVSCICVTKDRPKLLHESIQMFLKQDYPNKELIIVDSSKTPMKMSYSNVIYKHVPEQSIGSKRNIAMDLAKGSLIAWWDDDDYHGKQRLTTQAEVMRNKDVDATTTKHQLYWNGIQLFTTSLQTQQHIWYRGIPMNCIMFRKSKTRFRELNMSEDRQFLIDSKWKRIDRTQIPFVYRCCQSGNTWQLKISPDDKWILYGPNSLINARKSVPRKSNKKTSKKKS